MTTRPSPGTSPVFPGGGSHQSEACCTSLSFTVPYWLFMQYDPPPAPRWYQFFSEKENTVL